MMSYQTLVLFSTVLAFVVSGCVATEPTVNITAGSKYSLCSITPSHERGMPVIVKAYLVRSSHFTTSLMDPKCPYSQYYVHVEAGDKINSQWNDIVSTLWSRHGSNYLHSGVKVTVKVKGYAEYLHQQNIFTVIRIVKYSIKKN